MGPERHIALFHAEGARQAPQSSVDVAAGDLVLATGIDAATRIVPLSAVEFNGTMEMFGTQIYKE